MKRLNAKQIVALMDVPCGILLIGPPCCGKSTFIGKLEELLPKFFVASTDNLIEAFAVSQGKTYSDVFRTVNFGALKREMMNGVAEAKKRSEHVVFDQTNMSKKSRAEKVKALFGYKRIAVTFPFELAELQRRNQVRAEATGKHIPDHVFKSMISNYNTPSKLEGFDEVIEVNG